MNTTNTLLAVRCDYCDQLHQATYSHEGIHGEGPIYAVVCTIPDPVRGECVDYYTTERLERVR